MKKINNSQKIFMANKLALKDQLTEFLLYSDGSGDIKVETYLHNETLWLPQKRIAELFGVDRSVISKHLRNILDSQELVKEVVCANFAHTTQHGAIAGKTQIINIKYYNLDAILSVGYRVNSSKATHKRFYGE